MFADQWPMCKKGMQLAVTSALVMVMLHCSLVFGLPLVEDRLVTPSPKYGHPERSLYLDMAVAGERVVAAGERGTIAYSDDGGSTWQQADVPVATTLTAVTFVDEKYGWACGHSGVVLHSDDGGRSWTLQFDGQQANEAVLQQAMSKKAELERQLATAAESERGDLEWALEDAQYALEDAEQDVQLGPTKPMLDIWFKNRQQGYVVGAYGYFFATRDGGKTWQNFATRLENFDRYHLNALSDMGPQSLLIVGEAGQLFASYDDGESWETLYGPYQGTLFGIQPLGKDGYALIYGLRGHLFKTLNGGQSWTRINLPIETTLADASMRSESQLTVVGFSGVVLESRDAGESFTLRRLHSLESYNAVVYSSSGQRFLASENGLRVTAKP